jgi:hypothetical protein
LVAKLADPPAIPDRAPLVFLVAAITPAVPTPAVLDAAIDPATIAVEIPIAAAVR